MREVDRRSKYNRRVFLQGAATTVPAVAAATSAGLGIDDAWAEDATDAVAGDAEDPGEGRARHLSARFAGRQLLHHRGQAVGRQGGEGPRRQGDDQGRRRPGSTRMRATITRCLTPRSPGKPIASSCCMRIEQTEFFTKIRGDLDRLALQPERGVAEVRLRGLLRRTWRLHQARLRRHRLAPEGLTFKAAMGFGKRTVREEQQWQNSI